MFRTLLHHKRYYQALLTWLILVCIGLRWWSTSPYIWWIYGWAIILLSFLILPKRLVVASGIWLLLLSCSLLLKFSFGLPPALPRLGLVVGTWTILITVTLSVLLRREKVTMSVVELPPTNPETTTEEL